MHSLAPFDVVGIAASAGGFKALARVVGGLPTDFPVPVVIVQHLAPRHPSLVAAILARSTGRSVKLAEDGELLKPGVVYVAPPDYHLLVDRDQRIQLSSGPLEQFVRPSANRLFESLASSFGDRCIVVVLSGSGSDGASGVATVRLAGGHTIAQDGATAEYSGMPASAVLTGSVRQVLRLELIADELVRLVRVPLT